MKIKTLLKSIPIILIIIAIISICFITGCSKNESKQDDFKSTETNEMITQKVSSPITFKSISGGTLPDFEMSETEITNQQYADFLNAALNKKLITIGKIEYNKQIVYDKKGNQMTNLLGYRVIKDHDKDGTFELWEMENPLNRMMIEYDEDKKVFSVINPQKVDWNIYFDTSIYQNVVDEITDWCEFHNFWQDGAIYEEKEIIPFSNDIYKIDGSTRDDITFAGHLDLDCELPTLEEVKNWPVNHIQYYGAKVFADFYGYALPSLQELQWAGKGGHSNWIYATNDGTINSENTVYNGGNDRSTGKHKGHPQRIATFTSNPYGIYDLSGNVAEWTRTTNTNGLGCRTNPSSSSPKDKDTKSMIRIDGAWPRPDIMCKISDCIVTDVTRGNDHFGFRVVKQ
jgi:formylglycine-generating enzyme required for sulfatase activity